MADASGVASMISGMGNIFGNILGVMAQENTNSWNAYLQKYSYDQQKEMIAQQNAYNSPAQQLARYREAGLNPNLIYGSITPGQQSEIAKYEPPVRVTPNYANVGSSIAQAVNNFMDNQLKKAEIDMRHQQFENAKEQQFLIRSQRHAQDIENMWNAVIKGFDPGLVSQAGDKKGILSSQGYLKYAEEIRSIQTMNEYRVSQKAYMDIQKDVATWNAKAKEYYYNEIQPLMMQIMEKRRDGLDTSNEILKLQKNWFRADKIFNYSKGVADAVARFISPINIGSSGGNFTPNSWYGSPMYPSESYIPGLP